MLERIVRRLGISGGGCALAGLLTASGSLFTLSASSAPPTIPISQVPLTVAIPAHPQVLFAVGNSESMDGDLSGAIRAGSGSLTSDLSLLQNSSSLVSYSVPAGFVPPVDPGAGGTAAYTVLQNGNLTDNSASRLNVAKAGINAVLQSFDAVADFGLMDYSTSSTVVFTTWVYHMSTPSGFVFTNTQLAGNRYVANPCYRFNTLPPADIVYQDCNGISTSGLYPGQDLNGSQYMQIDVTSDDPNINDVLYASGITPVCVTYGAVNPPNPYPPNYSLGTYNAGGVLEFYPFQAPGGCATVTGPTNAGFVPYSAQVMYSERGFGYYSFGQAHDTGNVLVPITTAGQIPSTASLANVVNTFAPSLAPETNTTATVEMKAAAVQSPVAGLLAGAGSYYRSANPASSNGCPPKRYVILLSDGLPTLDLAGSAWPPLGSISAAGYGVSATFNADGSLNTTNDQALTDTINSLTSLASAGVKVYIVGLGAGVDPSKNPAAAQTLTAMAIAGGTGSYFPATSPAALVSDLEAIMAEIIGATQTVSASAVNSTGLNTGSIVYQSQFSTQDSFQDWTGNLFAYPIDPATGGVSTVTSWSAQAQLDAQNYDSGRLIATWNPGTASGVPFRWNQAYPTSVSAPAISSTSALGLALTSTAINPVASDANGQDRLDYLRGRTSLEKRNGGSFRNRSHILGDIVDSSPVYVGAPSAAYLQGSYITFQKNNAHRKPVLYVGANDGMLHAFDVANGNELFAFIPNAVFGNLPKLTGPLYNAQHQFFVNGSPQAGDVQFADQSWHTVLAGTEAAGGNSVFALDVTSPASITSESALAQSVLWEFTDADLGATYSAPVIASINASPQYAVFFGNGYNSVNSKPVLYALNPQSGVVIAKIDLCAKVASACSTSAANGLSGVTVLNSSGSGGAQADLVYAGDLQGNLWRIDISKSDPAQWSVTVLFQATDNSGSQKPQPITAAPAVSLNPQFPRRQGTMVFFGTGQLLSIADLSTTQTQTVYGVFDPGTGGTYTRANLIGQTLSTNTASNGANVLTVTGNTVNLASVKGWYVDLTVQSGMRSITALRLESGGGLVLTTYSPNTSQCTGGGSAYLLVLNFATGGAFPQPEFVIPGLTLGTSKIGTSNPVGLFLGSVYAAAPTIISASLGATHGDKLITKSSGEIQSVLDRGRTQQRTGWWELQ